LLKKKLAGHEQVVGPVLVPGEQGQQPVLVKTVLACHVQLATDDDPAGETPLFLQDWQLLPSQ
jgi:hypothetical protein